jgi:hypothetical protein
MCDHGLAGPHIEGFRRGLHAEHPLKDDRELVELRFLARFHPTRRTLHARDTRRRRLAVHAAYVLFDDLGLVARGLDD